MNALHSDRYSESRKYRSVKAALITEYEISDLGLAGGEGLIRARLLRALTLRAHYVRPTRFAS